MMYEYFTYDSFYNVIAFSISETHIKEKVKFKLPIIPFEDIENQLNPDRYSMFIAIGYMKLNHIRAKFYYTAKQKGYELVSYRSSNAFLWRNVKLGDNCAIFENNVLQHNVKIGNNVILWSGNHIGHESIIEDHVYIASHVVISGSCTIGAYSFIGVNATFADHVKVGKNNLIGAGTYIAKDIDEAKVCCTKPAHLGEFCDLSPKARDMFEIPEGETI